ncbi:MAG: ABC transporter ATP-binding protein [Verrucomicrobiae bacterium]|nr:ABC transporter ATP-binding protein [Verrucomicrobiae bacterium]
MAIDEKSAVERMIGLEDVRKDYPLPHPVRGGERDVVHALAGVSLSVQPGEFVAVMGPSGCGKSTLLHVVGGLDMPSAGGVFVNGEAVHAMDGARLGLFRRRHVGVVFQFFNLLPQLTVMENVCLPLRLAGMPFADCRKRADEMLEKVGLPGKAERLPAELSGGEQQRVAIARALIHRPRVVLADEPTGNLDSHTSGMVLDVLRDLQREQQTTLLLVTHSPEVARQAHRTIRMQDGRIVD